MHSVDECDYMAEEIDKYTTKGFIQNRSTVILLLER